jgi:hypothetical protein
VDDRTAARVDEFARCSLENQARTRPTSRLLAQLVDGWNVILFELDCLRETASDSPCYYTKFITFWLCVVVFSIDGERESFEAEIIKAVYL